MEFLNTNEAEKHFPKIVPVFINAFRGDPWYEVSKCVDRQVPQRCKNGLSSTALNAICDSCSLQPEQPAYTYDGVVSDFKKDSESSETIWHIERVMSRVALAGYASRKNVELLVESSYSRTASEESWLNEIIGYQDFTWLHELFAGTEVRQSGNLRNFKEMCESMMSVLDTSVLAYSTINPRMVAAAQRNFGDNVQVFRRNVESPDHRDFVLIKK